MLLPEEVAAIRTSAAAVDVPPDRWTQVESLAYWWGTVSAARWVERLQQQSGLTEERALAIAATKLGLNFDTLRSRLKRIFNQGYGL